jgi:hypothetical protein
MKRALVFTATLVLAVSSMPVAAWMTNISITSENRTMDFVIGTTDTATDDFDPGIDIPLPPPPPSSNFNAYMTGSGIFDMLQKDIRHTPTWSLYVKSKKGIDIQWDPAPISLTMEIGNSVFFLNHSGKHSLNSGEYRILIQQENNSLSLTTTALVEPFPDSYLTDLPEYSPVTTVPVGVIPFTVLVTSPQQNQLIPTSPLADQSDGQISYQPDSTQTVSTNRKDMGNFTPDEKNTSQAATPSQKSPGFGIGVTVLCIGIWIEKRKYNHM